MLLDVRWALGDPHGREHYLAAHLPGAVFVDLDTELADPPSAGRGAAPAAVAAAAAGSGPPVGDLRRRRRRRLRRVRRRRGARAWWLLRWGGLADVRLLDGGLAAWQRAGGALETGDVVPEPGDVTLTGGGCRCSRSDEAAALPRAGGVLLDARAAERYRGEVEPVDPRAGHVPGAVSAPTTENLVARRHVPASRLY